jgi:hypothetical protein
VSFRERSRERSRAVQLDDTDAGTTLNVVVASRTNVEVTLNRPVALALPRGVQVVTAVRLFADEPRMLVTQMRTQLEDRARAERTGT